MRAFFLRSATGTASMMDSACALPSRSTVTLVVVDSTCLLSGAEPPLLASIRAPRLLDLRRLAPRSTGPAPAAPEERLLLLLCCPPSGTPRRCLDSPRASWVSSKLRSDTSRMDSTDSSTGARWTPPSWPFFMGEFLGRVVVLMPRTRSRVSLSTPPCPPSDNRMFFSISNWKESIKDESVI